MRLGLYALGLAALGSLFVTVVGCSDDTGGSGGSGGSGNGSSSSSSGTGGAGGAGGGSSSSSGSGGSGGAGGGSSSSSGSGGSGSYSVCSDCTSNTTGAYVNECKALADACTADADCKALADCSYDNCPLSGDGGCCTIKCAQDLATPQAALNKFEALDSCVFCQTCKTICMSDGAPEYCAVVEAANPNCP
ncbi:hypothetical protein [Polyangium jinanense]|uniref:Uncharacterized protein n=1 Tax=Polyangium jinanense TaxID=2829994 RepID=A0A9X3X699_9BACT|nr:hypothetical protein [Polyangium jinanense]MDC3960105.1 hypothetical protein [Polyangium jinanense]MDC3984422.1 hypothetical protein [Polyangium jinanense]